MTEPNGLTNGGSAPAQQQQRPAITMHFGFAWTVGLRSGFGHQVVGVNVPVVSPRQLDEIAQAIAKERSQFEPTHPDYVPEGAKVSILAVSVLHIEQPKQRTPIIAPVGFDPRGRRR